MVELSLEKFLGVGLVVMVEFQEQVNRRKRIRSMICGWQQGAFLLIGWPGESHQEAGLFRGLPCTVRFLHEGHICGFRTKVIEPGTRAYPQFRVSWPDRVEVVSLRKYERVAMAVPCLLQLDNGQQVNAEMCNLGVGGCSVCAERELSVGTEARLSFSPMDGPHIGNAKVIVKSNINVGSQVETGLEFVDLDDVLRKDMEFLVAARSGAMRTTGTPVRRVLVFEEDAARQERLRECLKQAGFKVTAVCSAVDAFHLVRSWHPDAMVVSAHGGYLSGAQVCSILRGARGCENLPIVVFDEDERHGSDAKAVAAWGGWFCSGLDGIAQTVDEILSRDPAAAQEQLSAR